MCQTQCYLKTCLLLILTIISLRLKGTFFSYLDSFQLLFNAASGMFKWEGAVEIQPWFSCKGTHSSLKPNVFKCWEQKGCGYGRKKICSLRKRVSGLLQIEPEIKIQHYTIFLPPYILLCEWRIIAEKSIFTFTAIARCLPWVKISFIILLHIGILRRAF